MIPGGHYEPWRNRPSSLYAYERLPTVADHLHYPGGRWQEARGETPDSVSLWRRYGSVSASNCSSLSSSPRSIWTASRLNRSGSMARLAVD